jgi:hypothetical protein
MSLKRLRNGNLCLEIDLNDIQDFIQMVETATQIRFVRQLKTQEVFKESKQNFYN